MVNSQGIKLLVEKAFIDKLVITCFAWNTDDLAVIFFPLVKP